MGCVFGENGEGACRELCIYFYENNMIGEGGVSCVEDIEAGWNCFWGYISINDTRLSTPPLCSLYYTPPPS